MRPRSDDAREVDAASATLARDIEKIWRNWKAFITEQLADLAAQQADESPEADLTGMARPVVRKARIDAATRQHFGAVLEARRQQAQTRAEQEAREAGTPAPDADQVYLRLLQHIMAELDGKIHPSGKALVYYKDQLLVFDADAVGAGTTEADFLAAGSGAGPTKQQAFMALAAIAVLGVALFWLFPFFFGSSTTTPAAATSTARVGQQDVALWNVTGAAIGTRTVAATVRGSYPLILCMDEPSAKAATPGTTVVLSSTEAVRHYQIAPQSLDSSSQGDLTLADCGGSTPKTRMVALLMETLTYQPLDENTLQGLNVRGPDLDPQAIPANQMEVTIQVSLRDAGTGTLILADGRRWSPTRSTPEETGTKLTYLVPLSQVAQAAGWVLPGANGLPRLLTLSLPAPISRAALLRRVIAVDASQPTIALSDGIPEVRLTLSVTLAADAEPLTLLPDDLTVLAGSSQVSARWEPPRLTPGTPTTIALRIPLSNRTSLDLALANWRARLTTS